MTMEKAINICRSEEITKMQIKEMKSGKKWVTYQEIKNGRKHKKRMENQMIDRRKKIRRGQLRPWMGRM